MRLTLKGYLKIMFVKEGITRYTVVTQEMGTQKEALYHFFSLFLKIHENP